MARGNAALLDQIDRLNKAIEEKRSKRVSGSEEDRGRLGARKGSNNRTLVVERGIVVQDSKGGSSAGHLVEDGEKPGSSSVAGDPGGQPGPSQASTSLWVKKSGRHMQLVNATDYKKNESQKLKAIKESRDAALAEKKMIQLRRLERRQQRNEAAVAKRRMIFDGILFERDPSGRKLIRREVLDSGYSTTSKHSLESPKSVVVDGTKYLRSKNGNLIPARLVKQYLNRSLDANGTHGQRNKTVRIVNRAKKLCVFYTRYGKSYKAVCPSCHHPTSPGMCKRGEDCPYLHDTEKRSLCPRVIKKTCPHLAEPDECLLSHQVDSYRTPHCREYVAGLACPRTNACPYPHIALDKDAKVCKDFAVLGYCKNGRDCKDRHVKECPDFAEKGQCANAKCHLPHVLRRALRTVIGPLHNSPLTDGQEIVADGEGAEKLRRTAHSNSLSRQQDLILFDDDEDEEDDEAPELPLPTNDDLDDAGYISFGDIDSEGLMSEGSQIDEDESSVEEAD